ncbi:MAG TPA: hypothetical protein VFB37_00265 [Steroidobacteraceae bacterium]|nr:hypothetical protein [Steroidobacteraceae bacterium]
MNRKSRLAVALAWVTAVLMTVSAQASQSARHEAAELHRAKLSLIEAIVTAEKQGAGRAVSASFEFKRGNPAYFEVKVLSPDGRKLTGYKLDPRTGQVQDTSNEALEKLISRITPESLSRAPTTMTHAIALAQEHSGGHAVSADVDHDGDQINYTVETVKADGASQKLKVQGADGKVLSSD